MDKDAWGSWKVLVLCLLMLNTFFIGSMWYIMVAKCSSGSCHGKAGAEKVCPLHGISHGDAEHKHEAKGSGH